jgi:GH15 family glucan-1,4-alpha-glucosidase
VRNFHQASWALISDKVFFLIAMIVAALKGRTFARGGSRYMEFERSMPSPIEDYALIGDCHTAALVSRNGSIDWLCFPRFDSGACFAALLGNEDHGRWMIAPAGDVRATRRRYREGTLVLETDYETADGAVTVIDCMPPRSQEADVVRMVVGKSGRVRMRLQLVGFLPPSDPRIKGTIEAVERSLMADGFVLRYRCDPKIDGLPPGEASFLPCTFWFADNLMLLGRKADARRLFERLLGLCNDVGLLSEEYDPRTKRLLGNFPQAFSHVALINSAWNLSRAAGPAADRPRS